MKTKLLFLTAVLAAAVGGCASTHKPAPEIVLDAPIPKQAEPLPDPPKPVTVVPMPQPLPLPGQLKPLDVEAARPEATDPRERVTQANQEARVPPTRDGYLNAVQVWPYTEGALYQVFASPGRVTDIVLQEGEELVTVSAGDTVRWIVGDTTSASGAAQHVHVLVKPVRANLKTNLVIATSRRIYLIELTATADTWMASVSWNYPRDQLTALKNQAQRAEAAAPVASGIALERLSFRYEITGDTASWRPLRAFDDGEHVYIQFPPGIAQGELPPVFVVGTTGKAELVNYRYRAPYYIVDRLFGAAELRLGGEQAQIVRVTRTDGIKRGGNS
jgi:P-type conjugative transfer protein TrbG